MGKSIIILCPGCIPAGGLFLLSIPGLIKLVRRRQRPFAGLHFYGIRWADINARPTGKTVRDHIFPLEDCIHHSGWTGFCACLTTYAAFIINLDLEETDFFHQPTDQPERTEELTPGPINKEAEQQD